MARVKRGVTTHARHKKIIDMAKGYRGRSNSCFRVAIEKVEKALRYAYRDRRTNKRNFRRLWITRINAGARANGTTYGRLINGLNLAGITLNRKMLAELAAREPANFTAIVKQAQAALDAKPKAAAKPAKKKAA
jgi:large subunit ribosomal protein L20